MDTRPDVFSPDSQAFFDLEASENVLLEERTQLAAARLAFALCVDGAIEKVTREELWEAIERHERVIASVSRFAEGVSTPEPA